MNLYETEALTFDPESRRGESTAADVFFFSFLFVFFLVCFCSLPSGSINVHGAFLWRVSVLWKKKKANTEREKKETSDCSSLSISCLNLRELSCTRRV